MNLYIYIYIYIYICIYMEDVRVKLNPGLPCKSCVQEEEDSLYQQIGLKFEEETSKMLHLEHGFVWY